MALRPPDPRLADDVVSLRPLAFRDVSAVEAALDDPEITRWFDNGGVSGAGRRRPCGVALGTVRGRRIRDRRRRRLRRLDLAQPRPERPCRRWLLAPAACARKGSRDTRALAGFAMGIQRARRPADQFAHRSEERLVATGRRTSRFPSGGRAPFVGRRQRRTRRPRVVLAAPVGSLARTLERELTEAGAAGLEPATSWRDQVIPVVKPFGLDVVRGASAGRVRFAAHLRSRREGP